MNDPTDNSLTTGQKTRALPACDLFISENMSRDEFAGLIKRGNGRAALYAHQHGLANVADIVLDACLKENAYDRQCEPGRAQWLLNMIDGTDEYPAIAAAVVAALFTETDGRDIEHLCEMTAKMGKNGDPAAAAALRKRVLEQVISSDETQYGLSALVELDGIEAVVKMARRYGNFWLKYADNVSISLGEMTGEHDLEEQAHAQLTRLAEKDEAIKSFLIKVEPWRATMETAATPTLVERQAINRERTRRELPLQKILDDATAGRGEIPARYVIFGKAATSDELSTVFQKLLVENEEPALLRLLWVFRRATLPELHPHVFKLARSENVEIRAAAVNALAQVRDPKVGEFGRSRLQSAEFSEGDSEMLCVFIKNFQKNDEILIFSALSRISPDEDDCHCLGSDILAIFKEHASAVFARLLQWVYETNRCGVCRRQALEGLIKIGAASPAIVEESLHDANVDIQEIARAYITRSLKITTMKK